MRRILLIALLVFTVLSAPVKAVQTPEDLIQDAVLVLREFTDQPDSEYLQNMLKKAYGVAVFPRVIKAGLGLGGRFGEGLLLQFDPKTAIWYGPYFANLRGLSYGFQIGLQSTALVLVVTSARGMESLKEEKITLGGNLSVATGPLGRSAEAGTDLGLTAALYSYSMSKGVFIGASLEGAVIANNVNANLVYWQEKLTPAQALARQASGQLIKPLLGELNSIINRTTGGL